MNPEAETVRDAELLEAVGGGDERAFAELHRRYAAVVFSFVLARTADRGAAEEVSADVWLGCWRSARAFRGDSQVLTWLLGIAKRQIWTHARRRRIPTAPLDEEIENLADDADDPAGLVAPRSASTSWSRRCGPCRRTSPRWSTSPGCTSCPTRRSPRRWGSPPGR